MNKKLTITEAIILIILLIIFYPIFLIIAAVLFTKYLIKWYKKFNIKRKYGVNPRHHKFR